ncbi:fibrinogen-like protein 1 [Dysidea avara]|uniref:fibrinogen-like protein 1 n=1 Tax=Dysidea avara TaxID=196820 RepID=UPI003317C23D
MTYPSVLEVTTFTVAAASTATMLKLLLVTGLLSFTLVDGKQSENATMSSRFIDSCCDLGYGSFAFSRKTKPSGIYIIPNYCKDDHLKAEAYCDTGNGGGWLVVQRRKDGSIDFNNTWFEYEDGFGKLTGEFWYGLRALHCITRQGSWEMRIDIKYNDGTSNFLQYEQFKVASAKDNYKLSVGGFHGSTSDYMAYYNGMAFTTKDVDNDQFNGYNCAITNFGVDRPTGGWWYKSCHSNIMPNMLYTRQTGILRNSHFIEIKIKPTSC